MPVITPTAPTRRRRPSANPRRRRLPVKMNAGTWTDHRLHDYRTKGPARMFYVIFILIILSIVPIAMVYGNTGSAIPGLTYFAFIALWWFLGRPLSEAYVYSELRRVVAVRCPGCGERHSLVDQWSCGCGYHGHKRQHVYKFICPKCETHPGWFNCPRCDVSIML